MALRHDPNDGAAWGSQAITAGFQFVQPESGFGVIFLFRNYLHLIMKIIFIIAQGVKKTVMLCYI